VLLVGATLTFASADHPALLAAARALQGVAAGATWTAALAVIADTSPPDRLGFRIGLAETTGGAASLLAPPIGGLAIDAVGTGATFALAAVLPALVAPLAWAVPETRRAGARLAPARVVLPRLARQPEAVAGAAALAVSAGALALLEPLLPLDLASRLDLSSTGVGVVFAAGLLAYFVCTPLAGRWSDRHGRRAPILVGGLAMAASLPLLGIGPAAWVAAAFAVAGAGIGTMAAPTGPLLTEAVDRAGLTGMYGWSAGVINLVWAAGYALGPLVGGGLRAALPFWAVTIAAGAAIAIAAVLLHRRLARSPSHAGAVPPPQAGG
jgi:MFS family permease